MRYPHANYDQLVMKLNLERPLVFFDIESTGLNIASDSIIELCFVKVMPDGEERVKTWRVKPWDYERQCQREINPSAQAVHGISAEDLKDCPTFYQITEEVTEWLEGSDLAGFNSAKFDLPMLAEEVEREDGRCSEHIPYDGAPHTEGGIYVLLRTGPGKRPCSRG